MEKGTARAIIDAEGQAAVGWLMGQGWEREEAARVLDVAELVCLGGEPEQEVPEELAQRALAALSVWTTQR